MKELNLSKTFLIVEENPRTCEGCYMYDNYKFFEECVCDIILEEFLGTTQCPGKLALRKAYKWVPANTENISVGASVRFIDEDSFDAVITYIPHDSNQAVVKFNDDSEYACELHEIEVLIKEVI